MGYIRLKRRVSLGDERISADVILSKADLEAVHRYIIEPLKTGQRPPSRIFHKLSGYEAYEFRWDRSGRFRATCQMFVNAAGEVQVEWRRIGEHTIYDDP